MTQEQFLDDRMFILGLVPARLAKDKEDNHQTVLFYDEKPQEAGLWAVVTYRNIEGFPIVGINHFEHEDHARRYKDAIEPSIPLTSLGGRSPATPMPPADFAAWKAAHDFGDFDPDKAERLGAENRREIIVQTRDQFIACLQQVKNVTQGPGA